MLTGPKIWASDFGSRLERLAKYQGFSDKSRLLRCSQCTGKAKQMTKIKEPIRFDVAELPELATEVAISGAVKQQEVGGGVCLGIAVGIAIYAAY
jgi:hypothetical protein